jgi:hypothetical protein
MKSISRIKKVSLRLATEADKHIPAYDNTKLQAINQCPTWGIIRYTHHKTMYSGGRNMALEMGSAAHEFFAAVRLWQLRYYQQQPDLADFHGYRLYGTTRYQGMLSAIRNTQDERTQSLDFTLASLDGCGFYDDPNDRRRTLTNLEEACIAYVDRWDFNRMPVWVRTPDDVESDVGIECPFDIVITFEMIDDSVVQYRFIGKMDGLHERDDILYLHENKTASRLDDSWRNSFLLSSQVTGYCIAVGVWAGRPVQNAEVYGVTVPLPKSYDYGGIVRETVTRHDYHFARWFDWFLHTVELDQKYRNNIIDAPKYTHSCNRYFSSCQLIPFCDSSDEDQIEMLKDMHVEEWSPLFETSGD